MCMYTQKNKEMLPFLVITVVVIILLSLYLKWTRVKNYWIKRGVPHDPPHPLWGSLTFLQKENPGIWMRQMYRRFRTPYIGIWLFWRPALIINCPKIAQRVLIKDFDVFRNRLLGSGSGKVDPIGGLNMFMVNEPTWSYIRRPLTAMFTSAKMRMMHNLYTGKSAQLLQRIENHLRYCKPVELRTTFSDFTTDIIGIAAFGVEGEATLTGDGAMRSITKDFMRFSVLRGVAWCCIFFFPEMVEIFRFKMFPKTSENYFRRVFKEVVVQRGGYNGVSSVNDAVDILRNVKYEADKNGDALNEDFLIAQAAIMLQGGFDTTSAAMSFLVYELAYSPEVQEKIYNELLKAKHDHDDRELDASDFSALVYFNCAIKETLRKYSSMGWLDRVCDRDYRIDDSLTIPKGTTVYVNAIGMHGDPDIYSDPDKFQPERFLPETEDFNRPFMPFGEGPRSCIGRRFAYRTIWYAIGNLLLQYELQPIPGSKQPNDIEADKRGLFLTPGEDFFVRFVPRVQSKDWQLSVN